MSSRRLGLCLDPRIIPFRANLYSLLIKKALFCITKEEPIRIYLDENELQRLRRAFSDSDKPTKEVARGTIEPRGALPVYHTGEGLDICAPSMIPDSQVRGLVESRISSANKCHMLTSQNGPNTVAL